MLCDFVDDSSSFVSLYQQTQQNQVFSTISTITDSQVSILFDWKGYEINKKQHISKESQMINVLSFCQCNAILVVIGELK